MIEPIARAATAEGRASLAGDRAANGARERFNALQGELETLAAASNCPDVLLEVRQALATILNMAMREGRARAEAALDTLRAQLNDSALRLSELRDYALDADAAAQLGKRLAGEHGLLVINPILDQEVLMGWTISVQRAAR
jgi:hypothetical protein